MTSRPQGRTVRRMAGVVLAALVGFMALPAGADEVARGDSEWTRRAEGERDGSPKPDPIRAAIRFYEDALRSDPENLEARWKLLRSLHFAGDFAIEDSKETRRIFDRAKDVSEQGLELLADRAGFGVRLEQLEPAEIGPHLAAKGIPRSDVARLYFWSAINWGAWSRAVGLLGAVRNGVANRLFRCTRIAMALEPEYDGGAAFRLLGRLHAELPRVPFVSGWVDREQAIPLVERAYAIAPENPGNRLLLALTLLDLAPERRTEALALLEQVDQLTPRPSMQIEDLAMRVEARDRLATERAGGTT